MGFIHLKVYSVKLSTGMGVKSWEKTMCFAWGGHCQGLDVAVQGRLNLGVLQ